MSCGISFNSSPSPQSYAPRKGLSKLFARNWTCPYAFLALSPPLTKIDDCASSINSDKNVFQICPRFFKLYPSVCIFHQNGFILHYIPRCSLTTTNIITRQVFSYLQCKLVKFWGFINRYFPYIDRYSLFPYIRPSTFKVIYYIVYCI